MLKKIVVKHVFRSVSRMARAIDHWLMPVCDKSLHVRCTEILLPNKSTRVLELVGFQFTWILGFIGNFIRPLITLQENISAFSSLTLFPLDKDIFYHHYTKPSKNKVKRCLQKIMTLKDFKFSSANILTATSHSETPKACLISSSITLFCLLERQNWASAESTELIV